MRGRRWALLCQLAAWFNAYCLVRTVSSALEALAVVAALHHLGAWHAAAAAAAAAAPPAGGCWAEAPYAVSGGAGGSRVGEGSGVGQLRAALLAAGLGVVVRPPNLLFWLPIGECPSLPCLSASFDDGLSKVVLFTLEFGSLRTEKSAHYLCRPPESVPVLILLCFLWQSSCWSVIHGRPLLQHLRRLVLASISRSHPDYSGNSSPPSFRAQQRWRDKSQACD